MFRVLTVGWEPALADRLLAPIAARTGMEFIHGIVGDARALPIIARRYPGQRWEALSKSSQEPLPTPDPRLLAALEGPGIPTVRAMIRGDRVLRYRDPAEALGYITLLARRLGRLVDDLRPDVVLGSFDSAHAAVGLAVAKSRRIPWVTLAFTVIPEDLTAFCRGLTPEQLVPITRPVNETLKQEARDVLHRYRSRQVRIAAYRAPVTATQQVQHFAYQARNLARRVVRRKALGVDSFTFPSIAERLNDVARRSLNRLRLPAGDMLLAPPTNRYVFFPLHMAPESSVDTWAPMYQNQLELAVQLSLAVPADVDVVVKLHFSDPDNYSRAQLRPLMRQPGFRIAHPAASSAAFIEQAALVAGITGTACLEAALMGRPVVLFGDSPYRHFPLSERAAAPDELADQIRRMLTGRAVDDEAIVEAFAAYIARYLPGRINEWSRPLLEPEVDRLADCFRMLMKYLELPQNRSTWYDHAPFTDLETTPREVPLGFALA